MLLEIVVLGALRLWRPVIRRSCGDMPCGLFVDIARLAGVFVRVAHVHADGYLKLEMLAERRQQFRTTLCTDC